MVSVLRESLRTIQPDTPWVREIFWIVLVLLAVAALIPRITSLLRHLQLASTRRAWGKVLKPATDAIRAFWRDSEPRPAHPRVRSAFLFLFATYEAVLVAWFGLYMSCLILLVAMGVGASESIHGKRLVGVGLFVAFFSVLSFRWLVWTKRKAEKDYVAAKALWRVNS